MPTEKPTEKPMSKPKTPRQFNKKAIIVIIIIAISSIILITPALYYDSFTLQIGKIVFAETTIVGQPGLTYSGYAGRTEAHSVYDYTYSIEPGGIFRATDTFVSATQGSARITIKITVLAPATKAFSFESPSLTGGIGERSHAIYLGPSEGVRDPGLYTATITVMATIIPASSPSQTQTVTLPSIFFQLLA